MDAYRLAVNRITSSNAATNAPVQITYAKRHIGMRAPASTYAINLDCWFRKFTKLTAPASITRAPRVGITIAAAPAANPATTGSHRLRCGFSTLLRTAQAATIE